MPCLVSGQLPRRTIPHRTGFGPDEGFYSVVVILISGELSWWGIVLGIVVLVGNGWALFLSGGELSSWGVVLELPCPRTLLLLPGDSNQGPHGRESVALSTEPQQL